jgi:uncharacterized peroxidase-related enzyme
MFVANLPTVFSAKLFAYMGLQIFVPVAPNLHLPLWASDRFPECATRQMQRSGQMSRLTKVIADQASGKAKELLDGVHAKLGMTPNMMKTMATSPAVLDAYLQFSGALGKGRLPAKVREQIALAVGQANGCDYCLAAHTAIGKMVGLTTEQIRDSRTASAIDAKTNAILEFSRRIVETRGEVMDADVANARSAGLDDGAIAEIVANVALNLFTNYFNHVAQTEVDFPAAERLEVANVG